METCPHCSFQSAVHFQVLHHRYLAHGEQLCFECEAAFPTAEALREHLGGCPAAQQHFQETLACYEARLTPEERETQRQARSLGFTPAS